MDLGLKDKVALVTGGAGAIGSATAERFLREGSVVVIGDVDEDAGREALETFAPEFAGRIFFERLDLRDESDTRRFARSVRDRHGGVDCIINNAAAFYFNELVDWPALQPLDDHYWIGLRGPVALVQECWRLSERSRSGSVVNISSVAGHVAEPSAVAYTPIKAALKGFTLSCAMEMSEFGGWSVSISPGHTWTPVHQKRAADQGMTKEEYEASQPNIQSSMIGRFLDPREVADWIVLAASNMGRPLTGQDIKVTGGIEPGGFNRNYMTCDNE